MLLGPGRPTCVYDVLLQHRRRVRLGAQAAARLLAKLVYFVPTCRQLQKEGDLYQNTGAGHDGSDVVRKGIPVAYRRKERATS